MNVNAEIEIDDDEIIEVVTNSDTFHQAVRDSVEDVDLSDSVFQNYNWTSEVNDAVEDRFVSVDDFDPQSVSDQLDTLQEDVDDLVTKVGNLSAGIEDVNTERIKNIVWEVLREANFSITIEEPIPTPDFSAGVEAQATDVEVTSYTDPIRYV